MSMSPKDPYRGRRPEPWRDVVAMLIIGIILLYAINVVSGDVIIRFTGN